MTTVSSSWKHEDYSTLYSNTLIDLAISVDADELATQNSDDTESSSLSNSQQEAYKSNTLNVKAKNGYQPNLLTVFSSPCSTRLNNPQSDDDELPEYVVNMMENDVALQRLVKTGSVTISKVKEEHKKEKSDEDKGSFGNVDDWTGYPAACKLLEFVHLSLQPIPSSPKVGNKSNFHKSNVKKLPVVIPNIPLPTRSSKRTRKDEEIEIPHVDPMKFLEVSLKEDNAKADDSHRRKYICKYCQKKFCWSTDLKRHTLIHTGERPFKCTECPANFTRKFLMQKHFKKTHSINPPRSENGGIITNNDENEDDDFYKVATLIGDSQSQSNNLMDFKPEIDDFDEFELDDEEEDDEEYLEIQRNQKDIKYIDF